MVCEDTLKVKNLPKELTNLEKEEFLKHFGASKVKVITSKCKQKSTVFARFESKEVAREVMFRLHQTFVLKNRLCVEYAEHDIGPPRAKKVEETGSSSKEHFKIFINKLNAFNSSVDFQQPPPPHLKYSYPAANRWTINNIGHALATVPKFYTQVLHLMNRMHLPPPFAVLPENKAPPPKANPNPTPPPPQPKEDSSESELESDGESKQSSEVAPQKRKLPQQSRPPKRPKFIKPPQVVATTSKLAEPSEEVFEKVDVVQRKIEMKVSSGALENLPGETGSTGTIGIKPDENEERKIITEEELAANQIAAKDLNVLPAFKNYHPGAPTCRLYIKNIAKTVELKDLEFIYHRYKAEGDDTFDIRLMQEGRMKGQAFVSLSSVELAQKALKETNAYILKDKPLIVMFAKLAPAKK